MMFDLDHGDLMESFLERNSRGVESDPPPPARTEAPKPTPPPSTNWADEVGRTEDGAPIPGLDRRVTVAALVVQQIAADERLVAGDGVVIVGRASGRVIGLEEAGVEPSGVHIDPHQILDEVDDRGDEDSEPITANTGVIGIGTARTVGADLGEDAPIDAVLARMDESLAMAEEQVTAHGETVVAPPRVAIPVPAPAPRARTVPAMPARPSVDYTVGMPGPPVQSVRPTLPARPQAVAVASAPTADPADSTTRVLRPFEKGSGKMTVVIGKAKYRLRYWKEQKVMGLVVSPEEYDHLSPFGAKEYLIEFGPFGEIAERPSAFFPLVPVAPEKLKDFPLDEGERFLWLDHLSSLKKGHRESVFLLRLADRTGWEFKSPPPAPQPPPAISPSTTAPLPSTGSGAVPDQQPTELGDAYLLREMASDDDDLTRKPKVKARARRPPPKRKGWTLFHFIFVALALVAAGAGFAVFMITKSNLPTSMENAAGEIVAIPAVSDPVNQCLNKQRTGDVVGAVACCNSVPKSLQQRCRTERQAIGDSK